MDCAWHRSWRFGRFPSRKPFGSHIHIYSYLSCDPRTWPHTSTRHNRYECRSSSSCLFSFKAFRWLFKTGTQCFQNYYPGVHHHYRYVIPLAGVSHTLWFLLAGWVVLSGKTRVQDPRANFRNAFAGSSQSSNDVNYFLSHLPHLSYLIWHLLVCHCNVQSTRRLFRLVKCQLRPKRCQESRADPQDRGTSWAWNLRRSLYTQQYIVLRVRSPFCRIHTYCLLISWWLRSAASKQQILNSGVTVASLFFGEVFGSQAQKALTVFVALRFVGPTFCCICCWLWLQVLLGS